MQTNQPAAQAFAEAQGMLPLSEPNVETAEALKRVHMQTCQALVYAQNAFYRAGACGQQESRRLLDSLPCLGEAYDALRRAVEEQEEKMRAMGLEGGPDEIE